MTARTDRAALAGAKGASDDVHYQKTNPITLASTDLPYAALGLSPCRVVFDAERYVERVRPMPIDGGDFAFRFQTT
jgi:hypothetical protein